MTMTPAAHASLVLALLFACNDPMPAPAPTPAAPAPTPAAPSPAKATPATPAIAATLSAEDIEILDAPSPAGRPMPDWTPEPPPPDQPLPPGTPVGKGRVDTILALDEQSAVVRYLIPDVDWERAWWIARMRRDGSIVWVQPLSGHLKGNPHSAALVRVGDAVSLATEAFVGNETRTTLRWFALADGTPNTAIELGEGSLNSTVTDGQLRFDTRVSFQLFSTAELIASGPQGVVWRAVIGDGGPEGHDPTLIGDAIAVRSEVRGQDDARWQVFERSGHKRGEFTAMPQSCTDGRRWFVRRADGLLEVDATAVTTRRVLAPPTLPGTSGPWQIEDCTMADATPIVLVRRGARSALVALDPQTLAIAGSVDLGERTVRMNGIDPLPAWSHRVVAVRTTGGTAEALVVADPFAGRVIARWRGYYAIEFWAGGVVFPTDRTVSIIRGDTGLIEGRAVLSHASIDATQIAGDTLWLPPEMPTELGHRAPRVLSLKFATSDEVRDAVFADIESIDTAP